jgi:hypothetical protein
LFKNGILTTIPNSKPNLNKILQYNFFHTSH